MSKENNSTTSILSEELIQTKLSVEEEEEENEQEVIENTIENVGGGEGINKKKKKKRKTPGQKKAAALLKIEIEASLALPPPMILKISRNKHMKYISSYHGPWLSQLPQEVLDSLLQVNCDPESLPSYLKSNLINSNSESRSLRYQSLLSSSIDQYSGGGGGEEEEEKLPPPIDPAVFRGVTQIRKLVEEASDLSVRASSGLSAAALGAFNGSLDGNNGSGGINGSGGGRNTTMSPIRQHRLRSLAVSKLAEGYRIDEIATSVAVMQGSTGLDDIANRVLKYDPDNLDAKYVNFFHEKIPSRTLAISTDTTVLDQLITINPHALQYYRTRGIVHGFKQDYSSAIENFTQALNQAKATRKANAFHDAGLKSNISSSKKKGKSSSNKNHGSNHVNNGDGKDSSSSSSPVREEALGKIGKEPGDDLERQMLFHRGMAQFHFACKMIEDAVLGIEGIERPKGGLSNEGGELTLRNVGINLKDELAGLYGSASITKQEKYRNILQNSNLKEEVNLLLRKSIKDQERFLAYFAIWEAPLGSILEQERKQNNNSSSNPRSTERPLTFRGRRLIHHRSLSGRTFATDPRRPEVRNGTIEKEAALLTTYHPLLIESHFSILLNYLLLGEFELLKLQHAKIIRLMDYLEGYPIFLPARSLNQSQYAELLERLAFTWLKERELKGIKEEILLEGNLKSLHHLLSFFTDEFVEVLISQAEEDNNRSDLKEDIDPKSKATMGSNNKGSTSTKKFLESNMKESKSSWAEEREKAEAERRKIDPSYSVYNTARCEIALAWISAVTLPEQELEEEKLKEKGKGKGKASGSGSGSNQFSNGVGSSSSSGQASSSSSSSRMF